MSKLENLRKASSVADVAKLLGYETKSLTYIVFALPDGAKYTSFSISKKSGGSRQIEAPVTILKKLQRKLADLLNDCAEELLPSEEKISQDRNKKQTRRRATRAVAHGFKRGLSIASNAEMHKNKKYVLNLDLENFFPTINFGRVRGFFIKNKNFQLAPKVATILAQIACHNNALPQGSPCSPVISNFIGQILDARLIGLAIRHKCTYSRYVDDLTFSTNQASFPQSLAYKKRPKQSDWVIGKELSDCIVGAGFGINESKTRMQYEDSRQVVTGLVVNKFVNTKSEYYREARSMCHALFSKGSFTIPSGTQAIGKTPPRRRGNLFNEMVSWKSAIARKFRGLLGAQVDLESAETESGELLKEGSLNQLEGILSYIYLVKNYRNKYAHEGYRKSRHDGYIKPRKDTDTPTYPPR